MMPATPALSSASLSSGSSCPTTPPSDDGPAGCPSAGDPLPTAPALLAPALAAVWVAVTGRPPTAASLAFGRAWLSMQLAGHDPATAGGPLPPDVAAAVPPDGALLTSPARLTAAAAGVVAAGLVQPCDPDSAVVGGGPCAGPRGLLLLELCDAAVRCCRVAAGSVTAGVAAAAAAVAPCVMLAPDCDEGTIAVAQLTALQGRVVGLGAPRACRVAHALRCTACACTVEQPPAPELADVPAALRPGVIASAPESTQGAGQPAPQGRGRGRGGRGPFAAGRGGRAGFVCPVPRCGHPLVAGRAMAYRAQTVVLRLEVGPERGATRRVLLVGHTERLVGAVDIGDRAHLVAYRCDALHVDVAVGGGASAEHLLAAPPRPLPMGPAAVSFDALSAALAPHVVGHHSLKQLLLHCCCCTTRAPVEDPNGVLGLASAWGVGDCSGGRPRGLAVVLVGPPQSGKTALLSAVADAAPHSTSALSGALASLCGARRRLGAQALEAPLLPFTTTATATAATAEEARSTRHPGRRDKARLGHPVLDGPVRFGGLLAGATGGGVACIDAAEQLGGAAALTVATAISHGAAACPAPAAASDVTGQPGPQGASGAGVAVFDGVALAAISEADAWLSAAGQASGRHLRAVAPIAWRIDRRLSAAAERLLTSAVGTACSGAGPGASDDGSVAGSLLAAPHPALARTPPGGLEEARPVPSAAGTVDDGERPWYYQGTERSRASAGTTAGAEPVADGDDGAGVEAVDSAVLARILGAARDPAATPTPALGTCAAGLLLQALATFAPRMPAAVPLADAVSAIVRLVRARARVAAVCEATPPVVTGEHCAEVLELYARSLQRNRPRDDTAAPPPAPEVDALRAGTAAALRRCCEEEARCPPPCRDPEESHLGMLAHYHGAHPCGAGPTTDVGLHGLHGAVETGMPPPPSGLLVSPASHLGGKRRRTVSKKRFAMLLHGRLHHLALAHDRAAGGSSRNPVLRGPVLDHAAAVAGSIAGGEEFAGRTAEIVGVLRTEGLLLSVDGGTKVLAFDTAAG